MVNPLEFLVDFWRTSWIFTTEDFHLEMPFSASGTPFPGQGAMNFTKSTNYPMAFTP